MNPNPNKNWEILYPEDSSSIITRLMEKHGLKETTEEAIEKLGRGEVTIGEKIAGIVAEAAENKLSVVDISSALVEDLNIPKEKAEKLAKDLEKEILTHTKRVSTEKKEEITSLEGKEGVGLSEKPPVKKIEIKPEISPRESKERPPEESSEKPRRQDIYREPIE